MMEVSEGYWRRERSDDESKSSFDILAALPSFGESRLMPTQGEGSIPFVPLETPQAPVSGGGGSAESALGGRTDVDSDDELEAIRGSVRSLRAQRLAVEQLKEKAKHDERTAGVLKFKLGEAESRIRELETQGGKDVVRRLMDEVSELRSRLKATSAVLHTREKSIAELREAVRELEHDKRAAQAKARAQSERFEEQDRGSRETQASLKRLEATCASLKESAVTAERQAEEKCADSRREVESLSSLLRETKAALGASKGELEVTMANHIKMLDRARKEKEALLFETGQAQEKIKELTKLCDRQRSKLAESGQRARELERTALAAREERIMAEKQVTELRASVSEAHDRRKEDEVSAATKLRVIADRVDELKVALAEAKLETQEKERQLVKHREEMTAFREDVKKLRDLATQQAEVRQALRDRDETITELRGRLKLERRERGQWAQARTELLSQFCDEENKLRSTLQTEQPQRQKEQEQRSKQPHFAPSRHESNHERAQSLRQRSSGNSEQGDSFTRRMSAESVMQGGTVDGRKASCGHGGRGRANSDADGTRGDWCSERSEGEIKDGNGRVGASSDGERGRRRRQRGRTRSQQL